MSREEISRKVRMRAAVIVGLIAGGLTAVLSLVISLIYAVVIAGVVVGIIACAFVRIVLKWPVRPWVRKLYRDS
jgi:hypothetical protein